MAKAATGGSRIPAALVGLLGVIAVELVLLAALPYLATTDGPIHLGSAAALRDYLTDPAAPHRVYLEPLWFPVPNLTPEFLMATLLTATDPGTAEKLFLMGYVAGLPLALYYALGTARPVARWLALVAIPLTFSASLHFGFYNFCYGLIAFLVAVGFLLRHPTLDRRRDVLVFGLLMLLVYLTHVVPFVEAVLATALIAALAAVPAAAEAHRPLGRWIAGLAPWVVAVAPGLLLAALFFVQGGSEGSDYRRAFLTLLLGLPSLAWPLVSYDRLEAGVTVVLGLALFAMTAAAALARRERPRLREGDWALLFAAASTIAYLATPEALGSGGVISQRVALFPVLGLVLWLAHAPLDRRWFAGVAAASLVAATGLLVLRIPSYLSTSAAVADYLSIAPCMARHSTMAQANLSWIQSGPLGRISPLIHDAGRLAAMTHGHDLGSITGEVPLFPLQNRAANDPFQYLVTRQNGEYEVPPGIDPLGFEASTDGEVHYVVLFGRDRAAPETLTSSEWRELEAQLESGYQLVGVSPAGSVELFERDGAAAERGDRHRAADGDRCPRPPG